MKLTKKQKSLCLELFKIGAIKFGEFKLKLHDENPKAPLSPVYIDLRILRRFPKAKRAAVDVYVELLRPLKFDLLADVPTAATPLVSSLSDRLRVGMITPRKDAKKHGSGAKVDGMVREDKGKKAVMVDDLVTRADSKLEAAETLKSEGVRVKDIVVLIDRKQGGGRQLKSKGYRLRSALTMQQMLDFYLEKGVIKKRVYQNTVSGITALNKFLGIK
ncbi:hypothetical protein HYT33_01840 [Candidatus Roizmanbacteria bacterium]|nr:hypothetical protein [Candidatus Roizmanbacteria bacterium]